MRRGALTIAAAATLALGYVAFSARGEQPAVAQTSQQAATPTAGKASTVSEALIARVPQGREAVVRGDVLAGGRSVVIVADGEGAQAAGPSDWNSSLHRVDESGKIAFLASGLYHASRPLASVDGAVYVERGAIGAWPTREEAALGRLRTDPLRIDAIDPATGAARTLYTWTGYTLHLAGELGAELIVYRVAFEGADLIAIDRASGKSRLVTTLLPFARDFSIDEKRGALVMSNRDEHDSHLWVIDRIDLATGARNRLASAKDETPTYAGAEASTILSGPR
ncbi:MAG: hypothetical protein ABIP39_14050 [Polyangiaceae bacterium]